MAGRLDGRTAIVTGGADGIGRGIVECFLAEGANVVFGDRDRGQGAVTAQETGATFIPCDVTERGEVEALVSATANAFGSVDILVNNAWGGSLIGHIEHKSDEIMLRGFAMTVMAAKWAMQAAFPLMSERGWGRVVSLCSLNGVNAHIGTAEYNVGKEALRAFTRTAAREWAASGITCNIVCPASISAAYRRFRDANPEAAAITAGQNPMGRMGDALQDTAPVVLFLASEDSRYVTGNTLFVDGGAHINGVNWSPLLPDGA